VRGGAVEPFSSSGQLGLPWQACPAILRIIVSCWLWDGLCEEAGGLSTSMIQKPHSLVLL